MGRATVYRSSDWCRPARSERISLKGARSMHMFAHHHQRETGEAQADSTRGRVMNLGWRYDLMVWFFDTFVLRGRLRKLRLRTADLAQLQPGEAVLGVGGGTGALALEAYKRVGATRPLCGIYPRPPQVPRPPPQTQPASPPHDLPIGGSAPP